MHAGTIGYSSLKDVEELEILSPSRGADVTNDDLIAFRNVKNLKLQFCDEITDVSCLSNVQELTLEWCKFVRDVSPLVTVPLLTIEGFGIQNWGTMKPHTHRDKNIFKYGVLDE
jgi:hypothetical protein